ncbi:hypothetical protein [Enterobacter hormaechei]|uniref:hypothetical protein n=1 Tax=Enterobacter hormaechei TaxID=158836 RepID=UPI000668C834|nr:hypothetical protein [Enterobacter hormaechei]MBW7607922.1 hypothetical protein [Enterobacter hormaechei]MCW4851919.1 hypothetical protein [Enterobacter hormaechei subsp. xiangfangensis]MCW4958267.1 hypothetical protein [Enterobacter hormaechei subsp. xiangfangensis]
MSNIDKRALREAAEKHGDDDILALLDELEALRLANAAQDDHINQQQDRIDLLEKGNNEAAKQINSWRRMAKQNIAEREKDVSELNIARKRIAELEARDINIKQQAQALFEAIANPAEHYVPAYARCLREVLNGTSTAKGE